jgi:hypothetical protein
MMWIGATVWAACECPALTPQDALEQATYAFVGALSEIRTDKKTGATKLEFDVTDSFKGNPDDDVELIDSMKGTECELEAKERQTFLVYARWQWGNVVTSRCFGTRPIERESDAANLGASNSMKEKMYEQLQKLCMGRKDTPCCLNSLKIMSESHYLPEPEEGCPSGSIPDRATCAGSLRWCIPNEEAAHRHSKAD